MPKDWYEFALIVFILVGFAVAMRRNGQANPETTGQLSKRMAHLETKVGTVSRDVTAIGGSTASIERRVDEIERRSAKAGDIERLERQLAEHGKRQDEAAIQMGKIAELLATTAAAGTERGKQLDRLYDFIVERGMSK